ncbi:hypothetical protein BZJ20_13720 [Salinivibrio proteolyticus]|nr:hypothetical protein BZJ20_13720 [Salinivibrio proteolyticus]
MSAEASEIEMKQPRTLSVYLKVSLGALQLDVVNGLMRQHFLIERGAMIMPLSVYLNVFLGVFN